MDDNGVLYKGMSRKKASPATGGSKEILSGIQPVYEVRIRGCFRFSRLISLAVTTLFGL